MKGKVAESIFIKVGHGVMVIPRHDKNKGQDHGERPLSSGLPSGPENANR